MCVDGGGHADVERPSTLAATHDAKNGVNKVLMACLYGTSGTADKVPDIILQYPSEASSGMGSNGSPICPLSHFQTVHAH